MQPCTEFVEGGTLETFQGTEDSTQVSEDTNKEGGDPNLDSEKTYFCETIEEFKELERDIGVAARWCRPKKPGESPQWCSKWRWRPEDGLGWPVHGTDVY